jgi:hypothetical protein
MEADELPTSGARAQYILGLIVALTVTTVLLAIYYYGGIAGEEDETPVRAVAVTTTIAAITTGVVWFFTHAAYESATPSGLETRSLVLGILAALSVLGVWVGIFGPICAAAGMFGLKAIAAGETVKGYAGVAVGTLGFIISAILAVTAV